MCVTSHYLVENVTDPYPGWITNPYNPLRLLQVTEDRAIAIVRPQNPHDHPKGTVHSRTTHETFGSISFRDGSLFFSDNI